MNDWSIEDAAHLLRRGGFGGSLQQVVDFHALGKEQAIASLLTFQPINDLLASSTPALDVDRITGAVAIEYALKNALTGINPLQEKLTWFWHGHFTSSLTKCPAALMIIQNNTWRTHAGGNFLGFLKAMYKDPAMLIYLDNNTNVVGAANENFARELMELFTMGIGTYEEIDIKEAARALTGWVVVPGTGRSAFNPRRHDATEKTILGRTGNFDGDDVMEIVYSQPSTAPYICTKLYEFFVKPAPTQLEIATLVAAWKQSKGEILAVMKALFHLDSFWGTESRNALVKSPIDYALGIAQRWNLQDDRILRQLGRKLGAMGQRPLSPPHVAGYPTNLEWAGTSPLLARYNIANDLLYGPASNAIVEEMILGADLSTADKLVNTLVQRMGVESPTEATRNALLNYVGPNYGASSAEIAVKGRGLLHLIASTPEYQLH